MLRVQGFRLPVFVKWIGKRVWYLLRGIVLTSALGSTLTGRVLKPCFVLGVALYGMIFGCLVLYLYKVDLFFILKRGWIL